ncbi:Periplasmic [NiFeSe] hydrogenase large subunit [Sporomusa silvacetica DSM 10669]|uniref:Periplasmic [NiFeSe] hydrogenase large subunit n=1 Tax=Sporomusa silvacetica DSM 10669 TaxID=1123289 RepID=A0ABZ3IM99_9FIRM|nr:nickel-dependent hydrogenase large subunit [Sporomusa silvacetica]OZC15706.1 periplasmic [NiFeSe] hydrogenase large subunit [Sporomusa silvacetica DSM 10669]
MSPQKILFSPVTRLSGLLSAELTIEGNKIQEADVSCTMFRGFEYIMRERHVTDAVYLTQRICGICSTAHGALASYLLDTLYDNEIQDNAQYLRNIMLGADFLQNHIRHFYFFGLPDYVIMPNYPPFLEQNCNDCRLNDADNRNVALHYSNAVKASSQCHQLLTLFGGKVPHQHSFVHGGVAVAPTADKINQALALIRDIRNFINGCLLPDTKLIARCYKDYFTIGRTPGRFLSFGLFRFGNKNEQILWKDGILSGDHYSKPRLNLLQEDITYAWYERSQSMANSEVHPAPFKPAAYSWTKSVLYDGRHYEGGPLARMIFNGFYSGGTSTMDRIVARSLETELIAGLVEKWLTELEPGEPPIQQKNKLATDQAIAVTDAMRGPLLHSAQIRDEKVEYYDIITPTVWNFSPKDATGRRGPVESALVGTSIPTPELKYVIPGRIIRSFDPCISCATH